MHGGLEKGLGGGAEGDDAAAKVPVVRVRVREDGGEGAGDAGGVGEEFGVDVAESVGW